MPTAGSRAKRQARKTKLRGPKERNKMATVMREFHHGALYSSSGQKVTDPAQAAAIGYSEVKAKRQRKKKA